MEVLGIAKDKNNMLINDQIKVPQVLVIGPNGEQIEPEIETDDQGKF